LTGHSDHVTVVSHRDIWAGIGGEAAKRSRANEKLETGR